jgi:hypothetical protein
VLPGEFVVKIFSLAICLRSFCLARELLITPLLICPFDVNSPIIQPSFLIELLFEIVHFIIILRWKVLFDKMNPLLESRFDSPRGDSSASLFRIFSVGSILFKLVTFSFKNGKQELAS